MQKGEIVPGLPYGEVVYGSTEELKSMLSGRQTLFMEQQVEAFEAAAQSLGCDCIETQNSYFIYDNDTAELLMAFKEKSNPFCRCCLKPYHTANLYGYDVRADSPSRGQVLLQMYKPFRCGCCPACFDVCQAEGTFFQPSNMDTKDGPGESDPVFGITKVPPLGGVFTPTVSVMDRERTQTAKVTGPTLFYGGCLEFCSDQTFQLNVLNGGELVKDGGIVKLKPRDVNSKLRDAITDADKWKLFFPGTASVSDEERVRMLGTLVLLDYLFFETKGACTWYPLGCTLCNVYCCGCSTPCRLECNGDGG